MPDFLHKKSGQVSLPTLLSLPIDYSAKNYSVYRLSFVNQETVPLTHLACQQNRPLDIQPLSLTISLLQDF